MEIRESKDHLPPPQKKILTSKFGPRTERVKEHFFGLKALLMMTRVCFNPSSAGIDFRRQILTSVDVRF